MTIRKWHFYNATSGLFSPSCFSAQSEAHVSLNTPDGFIAIEGDFDCLSQRVDISKRDVIVSEGHADVDKATLMAVTDYQPPQPSSDHEWDVTTKRWILNAERKSLLDADALARAQLKELDAKQIRYVTEKLAGIPIDEKGEEEFTATIARKAELRKLLLR